MTQETNNMSKNEKEIAGRHDSVVLFSPIGDAPLGFDCNILRPLLLTLSRSLPVR